VANVAQGCPDAPAYAGRRDGAQSVLPLPDNPVAEVKMDIPEPLPRDLKIAITGRGHYYLKK
jgi:hypothetical protein